MLARGVCVRRWARGCKLWWQLALGAGGVGWECRRLEQPRRKPIPKQPVNPRSRVVREPAVPSKPSPWANTHAARTSRSMLLSTSTSGRSSGNARAISAVKSAAARPPRSPSETSISRRPPSDSFRIGTRAHGTRRRSRTTSGQLRSRAHACRRLRQWTAYALSSGARPLTGWGNTTPGAPRQRLGRGWGRASREGPMGGWMVLGGCVVTRDHADATAQ